MTKDNFQFGKTLAEQKTKLEVANSPLGIISIEDVPKTYAKGRTLVSDQKFINELTGTDYAKNLAAAKGIVY